MSALALSGWLIALAATAVASRQHARLRRHGELVAQATHEVRGALLAARLAVESFAVPAADLDLRRAALALDDLDLARASRRAPESCRVVDLAAFAEELAAGWSGCVRLGPTHAASVVADPVRLAQGVSNLLLNALEHGAQPITLSVRRSGGEARIEVADAGSGLPAPVGDLARAGRGRRGRRGHGLAIVTRIAEAAGGRLLSAPAASGARLVIALPALEGGGVEPQPLDVRVPEPRHDPLLRPFGPPRCEPEGIA